MTGGYSRGETGTDVYTLTETGTLGGAFADTVTGTDTYSTRETGDHAKDTYSRTTTEGGAWGRSATGGSLGSTTGTNTYTLTETGDALAGHFGRTATGTERYSLVETFDDVSNTGPSTTPGNITLESHGRPFRDPGGDLPDEPEPGPIGKQFSDLWVWSGRTNVLVFRSQADAWVKKLSAGGVAISYENEGGDPNSMFVRLVITPGSRTRAEHNRIAEALGLPDTPTAGDAVSERDHALRALYGGAIYYPQGYSDVYLYADPRSGQAFATVAPTPGPQPSLAELEAKERDDLADYARSLPTPPAVIRPGQEGQYEASIRGMRTQATAEYQRRREAELQQAIQSLPARDRAFIELAQRELDIKCARAWQAASPEGRAWMAARGGSPVPGAVNQVEDAVELARLPDRKAAADAEWLQRYAAWRNNFDTMQALQAIGPGEMGPGRRTAFSTPKSGPRPRPRETTAPPVAPQTSGAIPRLGPRGVDPAHHNANVLVRDASGQLRYHERLVSGSMTAEEQALGFPRGMMASHTEARAVRNIPLQPGETMVITGQRPPCTNCRGAMNQAARDTGATIIYRWRENGVTRTWTAGGN